MWDLDNRYIFVSSSRTHDLWHLNNYSSWGNNKSNLYCNGGLWIIAMKQMFFRLIQDNNKSRGILVGSIINMLLMFFLARLSLGALHYCIILPSLQAILFWLFG